MMIKFLNCLKNCWKHREENNPKRVKPKIWNKRPNEAKQEQAAADNNNKLASSRSHSLATFRAIARLCHPPLYLCLSSTLAHWHSGEFFGEFVVSFRPSLWRFVVRRLVAWSLCCSIRFMTLRVLCLRVCVCVSGLSCMCVCAVFSCQRRCRLALVVAVASPALFYSHTQLLTHIQTSVPAHDVSGSLPPQHTPPPPTLAALKAPPPRSLSICHAAYCLLSCTFKCVRVSACVHSGARNYSTCLNCTHL